MFLKNYFKRVLVFKVFLNINQVPIKKISVTHTAECTFYQFFYFGF